MIDPKKTRRELFEKNKALFPAAPIRLFSKTDEEAKKLVLAAGQKYDGYTGAIGDIDLTTFPKAVQDAVYFTRKAELLAEGERILMDERPVYTTYEYAGTGFENLKRLWKDKYIPYSNGQIDAFNAYIFYGGMGAFFSTTKSAAPALRPQGDRRPIALVPTPSFPPFFYQLRQYYDIRPAPTKAENHFTPVPADIEAAGATPYDLLYLIVVSNPTAASIDPDDLRAMIRIAVKANPNVLVLLDAVYSRTLPQAEAAALWKVMTDPEYRERVAIIESLSKTYGRTGLRSGVAFIRNDKIEANIRNLAQNEVAGFSYAMQMESAGLLSLVPEDGVQALARHAALRREHFLDHYLDRYAQYLHPKNEQPVLINGGKWQGGLYAFLRLRDGVDPVEFFLETGIATVPGAPFFAGDQAMNNYIRVSFGMEEI